MLIKSHTVVHRLLRPRASTPSTRHEISGGALSTPGQAGIFGGNGQPVSRPSIRASASLDTSSEPRLRPPSSIEFHHDLVNVTPAPALSRLERTHDRVLGRAEMSRRMLVLRVVATAHVPACPAQPKMYPGVSHGEALLAAGSVRNIGHDGFQMVAGLRHGLTDLFSRTGRHLIRQRRTATRR